MKRIETCLSAEEWKYVKEWLEAKGWTQYRLVKEAVLEKVGNEPPKNPGTPDSFVQEDPA
ncbi:MAG: hypothetical protein KAU99_03260 [Thermoplasmata archaeon]|nr:hypothetical protein [Thermoplasmata archaeon]